MRLEVDYSPANNLPQQRLFLEATVPILADDGTVESVWLTGSLARGDADPLSSVDIFIDTDPSRDCQHESARRQATALKALDCGLGRGAYLLEGLTETGRRRSLAGITLDSVPAQPWRNELVAGGLRFTFGWCKGAMDDDCLSKIGPVYPIFRTGRPPSTSDRFRQLQSGSLKAPASDWVGERLSRFWIVLARLPSVVKRGEHLACHALLSELRTVLIDMVVALNGARRPESAWQVNRYLGAAQREAFEKSLVTVPPVPGSNRAGSSSWIGQAVALVVLYRWYAPQLSQMYATPYPQRAEETALNLLDSELEGWPSHITTG